MKTRHVYSLALLSALALASLLALGTFLYVVPSRIEAALTRILQDSFQASGTIRYGSIERKFAAIKFNDIRLDADGFNTIGEMRIHYNPIAYLRTGQLGKIRLSSVELTYSRNLKDILPVLQTAIKTPAPPWLLSFETLEISGLHVNLLTTNMGALRINMDGIVRSGDDGNKSLQFSAKSAQKHFAGQIDIAAQIDRAGAWHADINLNKGRYDDTDIKSSRISGALTVDTGLEKSFSKAELNIGLFKYGRYGFNEVALSGEWGMDDLQIIASGRAQKFEQIEFGLNYSASTPDNITGTIYTPSLPDLLQFHLQDPAWPIPKSGREPAPEKPKEPDEDPHAQTDEYEHNQDQDHDHGHENDSMPPPPSEIYLSYEIPLRDLTASTRNILLRFEELDIAGILRDNALNGVHASSFLQGALRVQLAQDSALVGGISLRGGFYDVQIGARQRSRIKNACGKTPETNTALNTIQRQRELTDTTIAINGAAANGMRDITINLPDGRRVICHDDLSWLWGVVTRPPADSAP